MKVANIHAPDDVRLDEVAVPVAGPDDVLVRVAACGVCGTDLTFIKLGGTGIPGHVTPMPLGHEAAGTAIVVGERVKGIKPGTRVIINPMGSSHIIGNGGGEGAFCDTLLVRDAVLNKSLYEVPVDMPLHIAALTEPLGVARHGVNRANPDPESKCVVFGVGPIGLGAVLWLKKRGVTNIVAVDVSEYRLAAAQKLGATHTLVAGSEDLREALTRLHGEGESVMGPAVGTDIFFDFAGASQVLTDAIDMAKQGARLLMVAIHPLPEQVDFTKVVVKELSILGSCGYPEEFPDVIADLHAMGSDANDLISHRFDFEQFMDAVAVARTGDSTKVMVEFSD